MEPNVDAVQTAMNASLGLLKGCEAHLDIAHVIDDESELLIDLRDSCRHSA